MTNTIIKFVACLRASGLKVSTSEVLDSANLLKFIDISNESQFKACLKTNFVKSQRDLNHFERLYILFFHDLNSNKIDDKYLDQKNINDMFFKDIEADSLNDDIFKSIVDFVNGDPMKYLEHIYHIHTIEEKPDQVLKSNMGSLSNRLEVMLKINNLRDKFAKFSGDNHSRISNDDIDRLKNFLNNRLDKAFDILRNEFKPTNDSLELIKSKKQHRKNLGQIPFSSLSPKEIMEMRDVIDKLVRKLKDVISRRYAKSKKGPIDIKKTIRRADRYHGVPLEIIYKNRSKHKAKIVTLCDVSGSVWSAARFMLNMLYSLQDCFSQVKSFVFISGITEVTEIFEKNKINIAIEQIMEHPDVKYQDLTDYGETFFQFKKNFIHYLNKKTTLIIVGDGRSNYMNPQESILDEIRSRCKRLIWLNPEPEQFWDTGDSEMKTYSAYLHEVRPCLNLNQLIDFIYELVL